MSSAASFAAVFVALFAAHSVGDHWVQTHHQACRKGGKGRVGRRACAAHVATLAVTKLAALAAMLLITGLHLPLLAVAVGLGVDAVSHYWADRRVTLARLARRLGKADFYDLGARSRCLGTGAYALDQSWHIGWLFITALIITA